MKNRYKQVKQMKFYESVKDALPHFLTAWIFRKIRGVPDTYSITLIISSWEVIKASKTLMLKVEMNFYLGIPR
jgi:hypothetical protein